MIQFIKSSFCNADGCVEIGFHKSSFCNADGCNADGCVEVHVSAAAYVRDSKDPDSPVLVYPIGAWERLMEAINYREDFVTWTVGSNSVDVIWVKTLNGHSMFVGTDSTGTGHILHFDAQETADFEAGVRAGEFHPQLAAA